MTQGHEGPGSCCISGGGPAGLMLGFLLARAGVRVTVLEKHADFLRDFRGDTIHPSTLDVIAELGLLDDVSRPAAPEGAGAHRARSTGCGSRWRISAACLRAASSWYDAAMGLPGFPCGPGARLPNFSLHMEHEVVALRRGGGRRNRGHRAFPLRQRRFRCGPRRRRRWTAQPPAAGGRAATQGLWLADRRTVVPPSKDRNDRDQTGGYIWPGLFLVMINRGDYWQCANVIPKGEGEAVKAAGLPALRAHLAGWLPFIRDNLESLTSPDQLKLLEVQVNRLQRWHDPGLLCIGDAAHAMSPVGGVGINLAIQDAVAAARLLAAPLRERRLSESDLRAVQARREFPTRVTQRAQVIIQSRVIRPVLARGGTTSDISTTPTFFPALAAATDAAVSSTALHSRTTHRCRRTAGAHRLGIGPICRCRSG